MEAVTLTAASRTTTGKGVARSLRRDGKIPAVIYGHGREPQPLTVDQRDVTRLLDAIGSEATLINLAIDNAPAVQALVREVQRNPVRRADVIHLDLYAVVANEPIIVDVPVHLVGTADGVRNQCGVVDHHLHRLSVKCLPGNIPDHIEIDVTPLRVGDAIHVRDVTVRGGELMHDADVSIVGVMSARVEAAAEPAADATASPEVIKKGKADEGEAGAES
jgi:large subunit ribosomal protein L25